MCPWFKWPGMQFDHMRCSLVFHSQTKIPYCPKPQIQLTKTRQFAYEWMQIKFQAAPIYPLDPNAIQKKCRLKNQAYNAIQNKSIDEQLRRTLQVQQVSDSSEQENYTVRFSYSNKFSNSNCGQSNRKILTIASNLSKPISEIHQACREYQN